MKIATSIQQSKRLLEAGISPETADITWLYKYPIGGKPHWALAVGHYLLYGELNEKDTVPAWSLGALWELCKEKGYSLEFNTKEDTPEGMIEHMVDILADPIISIMDKVANNEI